jgi:hypothetical protein
VDFSQCLNGLQFDDDFAFDDKIKSMLTDLMVAIEQRDGLLPHKRNSAERKFNGKGLLVDGFEKSGAKLTMDSNSRCND